MVVSVALTFALFEVAARACRGFRYLAAAAHRVLPPPLLPVLLIRPSGLQLQQWSWTVAPGVLKHTHLDPIACNSESASLPSLCSAGAQMVTKDQSSVQSLSGYIEACVLPCAHHIDTGIFPFCVECVCAECVWSRLGSSAAAGLSYTPSLVGTRLPCAAVSRLAGWMSHVMSLRG